MEAVAAVSAHSQIETAKAPGHWVLARLGKRVLRPGGLGATRTLLNKLQIWDHDDVVEFAPGMGITAEMIMQRCPASYIAIERDAPAAERLKRIVRNRGTVVNANAQDTGLAAGSATKIIGEAMLSMHPVQVKREIISEASRILTPGGCYGIHELVLTPGNAPESVRRKLARSMSGAIHHGVCPLSTVEWCNLLAEHGLKVYDIQYIPFRLLSPARVIADEGIAGATRFACNLLCDREARKRVLEMRKVFCECGDYLKAIVIVARKTC